MKKIWIPALCAAALCSASAFADPGGWYGPYGGPRYAPPPHHHQHRGYAYQPPVVVYQAPPVVYQVPPRVIYRERVAHPERPYYDYRAAPPYYERNRGYYPQANGNRVAGQAIGAVAGGIIGNQVGSGNGRVVATALGAVIGSVVGGNLSD